MKKSVDQITIHPDNIRIYGEPDDGLKENIGQFGLQHAIILNPGNQILSGARRFTAALALGWEEIECEVADPGDGDATVLYILNANAYRKAKTSFQQKMEADEYLRLLEAGKVTKADLRDRAKGWGVTTVGGDWSERTKQNKDTPAQLAASAAGISHMTYSRYRYLLDGGAAKEIEQAQEAGEITHEDAVRLKTDLRKTAEKVKRDETGVRTADNKVRDEIRRAKRTPKDPEVVRQEEAGRLVSDAHRLGNQYLQIVRRLLDEYPDTLSGFDAMQFAGFVFDLRDELMEMAGRGLLLLPEASHV